MTPRIRNTLIAAWLAPLLVAGTTQGAEVKEQAQVAPVPAVWKPVELQFSYLSLTTAYSCDALESRLARILSAVGAHPGTKVSVTGCPTSGPSDHAFVRITGGVPVPVSAETRSAAAKDSSRADLLKRLGVKPGLEMEEFPAVQKTIELSRERSLNLEPGDCELMEHLTRDVFPKIGVKVLDTTARCFPNTLPISTPRLRVSALVKAPLTEPAVKTDSASKPN